jgi:hypothetical protein
MLRSRAGRVLSLCWPPGIGWRSVGSLPSSSSPPPPTGGGVGLLGLGLGVGSLAVVFMYPMAVLKGALTVGGMFVARNLYARAAGWPEEKRAFVGRTANLAIRRVMKSSLRGSVIVAFMGAAAARVTGASFEGGGIARLHEM